MKNNLYFLVHVLFLVFSSKNEVKLGEILMNNALFCPLYLDRIIGWTG